MTNILLAEPGGEVQNPSSLSAFYDEAAHGAAISIDTTNKPSGAYSSIAFDSAVAGGAFHKYTCLAGLGAFRSTYQFSYTTVADVSTEIMEFSNSGGGNYGFLKLGTDAKLKWADANGTEQGSTTSALSSGANTFNRISVCISVSATPDLSVNIYINGTLELSLTGMSTAGRVASGLVNYGFGDYGGNLNGYVFRFSQVYVDDGSDLTDPGSMPMTVKFSSTVNANNFDTTGGTGAVNERPINEANYKEQAGSSQVSQNYAIEAASAGDKDITGTTTIGYMGWIWAKQSAVSGTPKITVNGTDYAITLTTSPAIYRQCVTSATYPANAATIGMVSGGTADDTFLYDCGLVIVYTPAAAATDTRTIKPVQMCSD